MHSHTPTDVRARSDSFDQSHIRCQRVFLLIRSLKEVEILIDRAPLITKQPLEHMLKIFHQYAMWTRFPHQILLGGVAVVVVVDYFYVIIGPLDHGALLLYYPSHCVQVAFP